jgi:hypothetical protein
MSAYRAYSMAICSELPLLLPERSESVPTPDVEARRGTLRQSDDESGLFVELEGVEARIPDESTVVVDPGRRGAPMVSKVVLKRCLPALLFERGGAILHASGAAVDGRGVAFLGPQDAGKSSLVTAMCQRGHRFLTDDVLTVVETDGVWRAVPSFPRISLAPETREALDVDRPKVASADGTSFGPWFDVEDRFEHESVPVDVIYILEERGSVESPNSRAIEGQRSMERLIRHSVLSPGLDLTDPLGRQFRQCTDLCQSVPVKVLERPDGVETIPDVVDRVEADLRAM